MNAKTKKTALIVLSAAAFILTALSSGFAYGFLGGTGWSFGTRFLVGLPLMMAPLTVAQLIFALFRKEK
ncbi:MAG: hypothetical protein HFF90_00185 [Oscillibacter sp.]|nr:hypothetical protein [Oscillibacter sp.]MCI9482339.1 hypothetical protein [Oscillibacter sp.]